MYPHYSLTEQIYSVSIGAKRIADFLDLDIRATIQDLVVYIVNTYDNMSEPIYYKSLVANINKPDLIKDFKILDSGIYVYVDKFLILVDSQAISAIEPFHLLDRVYIHAPKGRVVVKLFHYPFSCESTVSGYTLGVTRHGHDSSAALINNATGKVIAFEREERPLRVKPSFEFPLQAIRDVVDMAGIRADEIKSISVGHSIHWFEDAPSSKSPAINAFRDLGDGFMKDFSARFRSAYMFERIKEALPVLDLESVPIFFVRHHIAHAASMPIDVHQLDNESLFLVMDGRGEWDTITAWLLKNGDLKNVLHTGMPHTIGDMYNMMGRFMGWREFGFEGQIMGLAPYGEPRNPHEHKLYEIVASAYKDFAQIQLDTLNFKLNPKYFFGSFQPEYLAQVRGWVTPYTPSPYFLELLAPQFSPMPEGEQIDPSNPNHRPVCVLAYALQNRTQELILSLVENLKLQFPYIKSLCVSGGVALNVTTNGEIIRRGLFNNDNFITTPVPGDDGLSIGAALYFLHFYNRHQEVKRSYSSALLGREYSAFDVKVTLERFGLIGDKDCMEYFDLDDLVDTVATLIQQGHGIAWFQGREEAGPRALGARSILFPLSDPNSNLRANKSKRRQPWRPSAISILEEDAGLFLEHCTIAPYMSIAYLPSALNKQVFQSGLHPADNSTRPQTVNDEDAPHLSRLLKKIKHKTGLGAVLNTSFNRSEPIVHFPEDALNTLYYLEGVEYLAISNFLIRKGTYKPSIIAAAEEAKMQSAFKAFRETRNAHELLKILQSYPTYPQQVQIVFDGKYKIPMFKEGFDSKNLKDVIDCLSVTENFSDNTAIEIKPHDTPYKPVILRLLTNINRKSVL